MPQPYHLFLDDERNPRDVTWVRLPLVIWTIVRSYDDFVHVITARGLPAFITFDHDLADIHYINFQKFLKGKASYDELYANSEEKTGFHCAKWLIEYCLDNNVKLPEFTVHSMNSIGRDNIEGLLNNFKKFQSL